MVEGSAGVDPSDSQLAAASKAGSMLLLLLSHHLSPHRYLLSSKKFASSSSCGTVTHTNRQKISSTGKEKLIQCRLFLTRLRI
jgi:hypothetical protein